MSKVLENFLRFCLRNLDHSFAQNFQDLFGLWIAEARTSGYFVEFGALNGRDFSNTYMLEKLGWDGIVAEPHPGYSDTVAANRNCHFSPLCVYGKSGKSMEFRTVIGRPALSGLAKTSLRKDKAELRKNYRSVYVNTITLDDLLDMYEAPDEIDFVSIDTEGSEYKILERFNFGKRRIHAFCVEHNYTHRRRITRLFHKRGYANLFPEISGHDDWWVSVDRLDQLRPVSIDISKYFDEVFKTALHARRRTLHTHLKAFASS